ncbi:MAG TPA: DUF4190 domain-containing protein [Planctomycetota bacterium]|nr:DUF4190 domain-containing protein [Planctomycetota bacterium]
MERIQFACPECGKSVIVDRRYLGLSVACPACLKSVAAPLTASAYRTPEEAASPPKTPDGLPFKPCPHCMKYVSPRAKQCTSCGQRLDVKLPRTDWQVRRRGSRVSGMALTSLLFAILPVLCILAIILGYVALRRIRRSPLLYRGEALAEWGRGLGYLFTIGYLIVFLVWLLR